jgi:hypothetical protein
VRRRCSSLLSSVRRSGSDGPPSTSTRNTADLRPFAMRAWSTLDSTSASAAAERTTCQICASFRSSVSRLRSGERKRNRSRPNITCSSKAATCVRSRQKSPIEALVLRVLQKSPSISITVAPRPTGPRSADHRPALPPDRTLHYRHLRRVPRTFALRNARTGGPASRRPVGFVLFSSEFLRDFPRL